MTPDQNVKQLPGAFGQYIEHGWKLTLIPPGQKGPTHEGWNKPENALTPLAVIPPDYNCGLLHAYSGTCALDIDNWEMAEKWLAVRGVDIKALFLAPDAVQIDSGNPGHGKLLFSLPPFMAMPSKKIVEKIDNKDITILELRCATANNLSVQDVLPPSRHPSGSVYRWAGAGRWQNPPALPVALLTLWQQLMADDTKRKHSVGEGITPASWSEIVTALYSIDPDCDRKQWIDLGMALQSTENDQAFDLWNDWSSGGTKYRKAEMKSQWKSFKPKETGIGLGSLFHHAKNAGWRRPQPDVSELFSPVKDSRPVEEVKSEISLTPGVPKCDLSLWPDPLRARAVEVAAEVGCDPIVSLIAGLCAVSCAADKQMTLNISSTWNVAPTFWAMTIGEPSDKKTPGSKPMFTPLRKLEREDLLGHKSRLLEWEGKEAKRAAQMKQFREWQQSAESDLPNQSPPRVDDIATQPKEVKLLVTDSTTQKLVSMAEGRPRGFLLWLDEMNRWFTNLSNPRTTDDRGCWMQGYETGQYNFDRMGAGSIKVENLAVSIYGNCQPEVFRKNVAALSVDGILQRFIPVMIDSRKNGMWQEGVPEFLSHAGPYEHMLRRTFSLPVQHYVLSSQANQLFRLFCQNMLKIRAREKLLSASTNYQNALGKLEGNCARLILLFQLVLDPYNLTVSEAVARQAIRLMDSFFIPSLKFVFMEVGQQRNETANVMLDYIIQCASARPTVNMSEMRRSINMITDGKSARDRDNEIITTMDDFMNRGYVTLYQDHPRHPVWAVNPEIAVAFKNHRKMLIQARQETIEKIRRDVKEQTGKEATIGNAVGYDSLTE